MTEKKLISQCKQNVYSAQIQVYNIYKDKMYNASYRIVRSREDAEDIVQESFIKAFKKMHQINDELILGGWLRRIVINASLDFIRKRKRNFEFDDLRIVESEVEEKLESYSQFSIQQIKESINSLKDKYRIVLTLYLVEDYTHKEIGSMLSINESTVRNQYRRGKQQLIQKLNAIKITI